MTKHFWYRQLYRFLWVIVSLPIRLFLLIKSRQNPAYRQYWYERFGGKYPHPAQNVIWIHASSVGEVQASTPIIRILQQQLPEHTFLLTVFTPTGREQALSLFPNIQIRYLPFDRLRYVRQFLQQHRPRIAIFIETEIWLNYLEECLTLNIPIIFANARLSIRSVRSYQKFIDLFRPTLSQVNLVLAQTPQDKEHFEQIGVTNAVSVGNTKYDLTPSKIMYELAQHFRERIGERSVVVCASTRVYQQKNEAELLLRAWKQYGNPNTLLVIIPRHPEYFDLAYQSAIQLGFSTQKRSDEQAVLAQTQVWIGDSMGELLAYYLIADVAFVGGSLVDSGGQNMIEPISCGIPTLFGFSTYHFAEVASQAIKLGVAIQTKTAPEWAKTTLELLNNPDLLHSMKNNCQAFISENQGSSQKMAQAIINYIK